MKRKKNNLILPDVYLLDLAGPEQVFMKQLNWVLLLKLNTVLRRPRYQCCKYLARLKKFSSITINKGDYIFYSRCTGKFDPIFIVITVKEIAAWCRGDRQRCIHHSVCTGAFFPCKNRPAEWKRNARHLETYRGVETTLPAGTGYWYILLQKIGAYLPVAEL